MRRNIYVVFTFLSVSFATTPSLVKANGYGESPPWQFRTPADLGARTILLDVWLKQRARAYGPATVNTTNNYTTNIERQVNCSVNATSYGNWGNNSQVANSPTISGHSALATGNSAVLDGIVTGVPGGSLNNSSSQTNTGRIVASANGAFSVQNGGNVNHVLNSTQTNTGNQTATVSNSTACVGPIN